MVNIVQQAKQIIYNSEIMLYVSPEKIEEVFQQIHVIEDREEYIRLGGISKSNNLEAVDTKDGIYIGPDATPHTVIHEVLHRLSKEYDKEGKLIKSGITGDGTLPFGVQVNEGITDYLAAKLSGEKPRHYHQGHKLFTRLEPMIVKYTNDPNAIMQIYLNKDVQFIHDFLNYYGKDNTFENLYEKFLFMNDEKLNGLLDKVEENLNKDLKKRARKEKLTNFIDKIKNIFTRKDKGQKLLTDGSAHFRNEHQEFVQQYDINNFQSNMTQEDIQKYDEYQETVKQGNEQNNSEDQREE